MILGFRGDPFSVPNDVFGYKAWQRSSIGEGSAQLTPKKCSLKSCSKSCHTAAAHHSNREMYKYQKKNSSSVSRVTKLFAITDKSCRERKKKMKWKWAVLL